MRQGVRFAVGLLLALVLCAAAITALVTTAVTIKDALASGGSLLSFEARIRHYSDRWDKNDAGFGLIRSRHPFVLHFSVLALSWAVTLGTSVALRRLLDTEQHRKAASRGGKYDRRNH